MAEVVKAMEVMCSSGIPPDQAKNRIIDHFFPDSRAINLEEYKSKMEQLFNTVTKVAKPDADVPKWKTPDEEEVDKGYKDEQTSSEAPDCSSSSSEVPAEEVCVRPTFVIGPTLNKCANANVTGTIEDLFSSAKDLVETAQPLQALKQSESPVLVKNAKMDISEKLTGASTGNSNEVSPRSIRSPPRQAAAATFPSPSPPAKTENIPSPKCIVPPLDGPPVVTSRLPSPAAKKDKIQPSPKCKGTSAGSPAGDFSIRSAANRTGKWRKPSLLMLAGGVGVLAIGAFIYFRNK